MGMCKSSGNSDKRPKLRWLDDCSEQLQNDRSKLVASERLSNEGQRVMWSDGWPVWSNHIHKSRSSQV